LFIVVRFVFFQVAREPQKASES